MNHIPFYFLINLLDEKIIVPNNEKMCISIMFIQYQNYSLNIDFLLD